MKKLTLIILLLAGINFAAKAQLTQKSPEQRAAHATKSLRKVLNLTSDQASQVKGVFLARAEKMDSLKSNPPADKKGYHLAERNIKLSADQQLMTILNIDQQKQYQQWEKMKKDAHQAKKSATAPPAQG
jgi:hypothetical protein